MLTKPPGSAHNPGNGSSPPPGRCTSSTFSASSITVKIRTSTVVKGRGKSCLGEADLRMAMGGGLGFRIDGLYCTPLLVALSNYCGKCDRNLDDRHRRADGAAYSCTPPGRTKLASRSMY